MFDLSQKEAQEVIKLEKDDVIDWYKAYLQLPSPQCRRLAIRLWGCDTDFIEAQTEAADVQSIKDLTAFKDASQFYPSIC